MRKFFKYFSYTLIFMFMSIASAYGAITISVNNASNLQNSMIGGSSVQEIPKQISKIYENFSTTDAMQINLSANLASAEGNYIIDIAVDMDTSQSFENVALEGTLKIAGLARQDMINIDFSYQDGMAYFDMFNGRIAVDTNTVIEPIMSICKILDLQIPELGINLDQISPEMILGMLSNFTEEKTKDAITLAIDVPVVGKLNLVCDLKYNVQEFSLPTFAFDESSSLTVSSNIQYPETVEIAKKIESDYIKVGNLLNVAETVLDALDGENVAFDFGFDFEGNKIEGTIYADLANLSAMAYTNLLGSPLKIFAVDNIIYIEYQNI